MRRSVRWGIGLAVVTAGMMSASPALAADSYWPTKSGPVGVCFTSVDLNSTARAAAQQAAKRWNAVTTGLQVRYENCRSTDHVVSMKTGTFDQDSDGGIQIGLTESKGRWGTGTDTGDQLLTSATITYEETIIEQESTNPREQWGAVTCHEMGHALGLPHSTDPDSCMVTRTSATVDVPGAGDKKYLRKHYPGVSAAGSSSASPAPTTTTRRAPTTTGSRGSTSESDTTGILVVLGLAALLIGGPLAWGLTLAVRRSNRQQPWAPAPPNWGQPSYPGYSQQQYGAPQYVPHYAGAPQASQGYGPYGQQPAYDPNGYGQPHYQQAPAQQTPYDPYAAPYPQQPYQPQQQYPVPEQPTSYQQYDPNPPRPEHGPP